MKHVTRDGVKLAYVEAGIGPKSMLLVHGMQCDHTHMLPLLEHFAPLGYRVVALDVRGHGQSDKPHSDYSNQEFNDDLIFLCGELGLKRPIAMGHSFAGGNLVHLIAHRPDFFRAVVILDSGVRSLAKKSGELSAGYNRSRAEQRQFLGDRLFGRDDPPDYKSAVLDAMFSVPDHVVEKMRATVLSSDVAIAAQKTRIPALFLLADRPFTDPETLATLGDNWRIGQVVGAGHFIQTIAAPQVNAMIERFLELEGL